MSGKYQAYPEYKDSAVAGISTLPAHWAEVPLKHVATCNDGVLPENTDPDFEFHYIDISSVSKTEGVTRTEKLKFSAAPSRARRVVKSGDVIVSTVRTYLEAIAPISHQHEGMVASTGFAVIRPTRLESTFAQYALRAQHFIDEVVARSTGVSYPAINASDLVCISTPVPPIQEQRTIAAFLDHETARIDRLIEKQQRLIELLKEKRQAVISHAVTKGLDPDVPMKDSGVEWLGQMPEHWEVVPLRHLTSEVTVGIVVTPAKYYTESGVPCFRSLNVGENKIKNTSWVYISPESNQMLRKSQVHPGDIIVVRSGQTGTAAVVPKEHSGSNCIDLIIIRSANLYCSEFVCFQLNSEFAKRQIAMGSDGAIQQHFNVEVAKSLRLMVPPVTEQQEIAVYLQKSNGQFDRLVDKALSQIKLLQERRTALISAAVTGKIDVRNWQPNTSTQSDEPDLPMAAEQAGRYHV